MITLDSDQPADKDMLPNAQVIEIDEGESIIIPNAFQRALGLEQGGTYTVVQLEGLVLVTPKRLTSLDALEDMRSELEKVDITLENLLSGLNSVREQIYQERYGGATPDAANLS